MREDEAGTGRPIRLQRATRITTPGDPCTGPGRTDRPCRRLPLSRLARTLSAVAPLVLALAGPAARAQGSAPPAPVAGVPSSEEGTTSRRVRWQVAIEAPTRLRELLEAHLDLVRFTQVADREPITLAELGRLVEAAPDQARELLRTEGYFQVAARVQAEPPDAQGLVKLRLEVEPGPPATVERVRLFFEGALSVAADAGDPDAIALTNRLREAWSLPPGKVYDQAGWGEAKNAVISLLRARGYTAAVFSGTSARVDAARHAATLFLVVDSGALARFGAVRFEGLQHTREDDLRALVPFTAGEPLLEQSLLDFQDRLVKTTLFDAVAVTVEPEEGKEAATPVLVRVRERALHQTTVGLGVSETSGPRVTLEHLQQQVFGLAWQAKTKLQLGRSEQAASLDLLSHPQPGPYRNLIAGSAKRTQASGLTVTSLAGRLGRTQDTERIDRLVYLEGLRDTTRVDDGSTPTDTISAVTGNIHWVWRDLDHPVLPTRGTALAAELGSGRSFHTGGSGGWFTRALGRGTRYWTFGSDWYGQARLQVGQVFAADATTIPYTLLFRAGGDESVRGYDYQALGPTNAAGDAIGGRVLATGSLELARPVSPKLPSVWGAVFVDAGDAALSWSALQPRWGAGVGVRWRSPVGALKLDLAYGEALRRFRVHFTVGVVF